MAEAHARNLEVHAWMNPYRAAASAAVARHPSHVAERFPDFAYPYGDALWLDPGASVVQDHIVAVVRDVIERYDVDAIHFDDYFYPYPDGTPFPDDATYQAYLDGGGTLERGDWRRQNVHTLVGRVAREIAAIRPEVRFGISPFGIYRPGMPPGISGLDQVEAIYSDPLVWLDEGWLDYLAPQLYWPSTQREQAYGTLVRFWTEEARSKAHLLSGNYLAQLGTAEAWSVEEFRTQLAENRAAGAQGEIFYHVAPLVEDRLGIRTVLASEIYATPALAPARFGLPPREVAPPTLVAGEGGHALEHPAPESLRAFVVYREAEAGWVVDRILPATATSVALEPGVRWAVSAVDRAGFESAGRLANLD